MSGSPRAKIADVMITVTKPIEEKAPSVPAAFGAVGPTPPSLA